MTKRTPDQGLRPLYVFRPLVNAAALVAWAKRQGFRSTLEADDMHVTIAYSKAKVRWQDTAPLRDTVRVRGGRRAVERLGDEGKAVVLRFYSEDLHDRWSELTGDIGCSWDYPSYKQHVTLTLRAPGVDIDAVRPFAGELVFGPEVFRQPDADWAGKFPETELTESMTLDGMDPEQAYALFRASYERETGQAWSREKFLSRARNWRFYGDEGGFCCVRQQASGPRKLVGVAGDPRSVLKGLTELQADGGAIWGAVSESLARMAKKRGLIVPHLLPGGAFLVRTLIKVIPASVFGGEAPEVMADGGLAFAYADTGRAEKYLIGNKAYFAHALRLPQVADKIREAPGVRLAIRMMGLAG